MKTQSLNHKMSHKKAGSRAVVLASVLKQFCFFPLSFYTDHDLLPVLCHPFTCHLWEKKKNNNSKPKKPLLLASVCSYLSFTINPLKQTLGKMSG